MRTVCRSLQSSKEMRTVCRSSQNPHVNSLQDNTTQHSAYMRKVWGSSFLTVHNSMLAMLPSLRLFGAQSSWSVVACSKPCCAHSSSSSSFYKYGLFLLGIVSLLYTESFFSPLLNTVKSVNSCTHLQHTLHTLNLSELSHCSLFGDHYFCLYAHSVH